MQIYVYNQLPPSGHPAIMNISLLRTKEKSPAETIKKYMKTALAITDARYNGHTDASPGPKLKFSFFSFVITDTDDMFLKIGAT